MRKNKLLLLAIPIIFLFSCNVKLNPAKSNDAVSKLSQIQRDVNTLYAAPSFYADVQGQYVTIENEVTDLITFDKTRDKSGTITQQTVLLQNLVLKYDKEHKLYNHISLPIASLYKDYLTEAINNILKSENTLK